ncbi:MAG: hypothetical protein AAGJ37_08340 [Pseudomonadota bacterium]
MKKTVVAFLACISLLRTSDSFADYAQGCNDPEYQQYIDEQFAQFEAKNMRLLDDTLRDYNLSLSTSNNLYQVIASLSRHLKFSAQFEPVNEVAAKIDLIFKHANELSIDQHIAGDVFDGFSSETHSVGIARAWIAYRQGNHEESFEELLKSIDVTGSALLGSFGPDFDFIRQIYSDGHVAPVVSYIDKTETFWTGKRADDMRDVWRRMINAGCKIQFNSVDTIKAVELGLSIAET